MLRKQLMFRYRREMYALQLKYVYTALLILAFVGLNEAIANGRSRRRFGPSTASTKPSTNEVTEKSKTDQVVAASSHTESSQYRRGGAYSTDAGDYSYNNADINLIRPESKPLHTKITAKYTSSISIPADSLEDTETAEEYVAKAMGMYGSRLREPIRIPSETEVTSVEQTQSQQQPLHHTRHHASAALQQQHEQQHEILQHQQHEQLQHQQHEQSQHHQLQLQQQHQQQEQEQQLQNLHETQEKPEHFQYYSFSHKDAQRPSATGDERDESQNQVPQQYQYVSQVQAENEAAKAMLEAQMQAQIQEQMQQAQYAAKDHEQVQLQQQQQQQQQQEAQPTGEESANQPSAAVYEKDPVTRSYNIYEDHTEGYEGSQPHVERNYRTKYLYKPVSSSYHTSVNENEEKIRVSASTEIPKAEIMKQIEKSVMRYMKELEAEGKIVATPKNQESKTYFKVVTVPGTDEKRIASSSLKPKYSSPSNNYGDNYKHSIVHSSGPSSSSQSHSSGPSKYTKNSDNKNSYVLENESTYQNSGHDVSEVLAPNVEFIYKIKTKAPLHTATVKTVSKPYSLPLKPTYEQFDHSTALKNLEEFDLSHVVTTPDPDDHQSITSASTNKPSKLYFNSEIYHDINSMPFKQKQRAENEYRPEYRKKSANQEPHPDYKGYSGATSGYYAEPPSAEGERERERDMTGSGGAEDGYPSMHPYQQYVLKKESSKYEEAPSNYEQPRSHKYKSIEFDSYNPKFNNNPEGYGYQQTYKTHLTSRHAPGKRGKRGGAPHPNQTKKSHRSSTMKEFEANVALRPPPKV